MDLTADDLPADPVVTTLPRQLERLEAELVELSSQLAAATCRLLVLIGEFDEAEGWRSWGMRSTAHWLSWQCGVGLNAAREQVRVARVMRTFPVITEAFAAGRLSFSKVRAITRIATVGTVETLVDWALHSTAAQLERVVAGQRRVIRAQDVRARKAVRGVTWRWDDDGSLIGSFRLPPEDGARFLQALDVAKDRLPDPVPAADEAQDAAVPPCADCQSAGVEAHDHCPDVTAVTLSGRRSRARSDADALVAIADLQLTSAEHASNPDTEPGGLPGLATDRFQLVIHASAEALSRPDGSHDDQSDGIMVENGARLHPAIGRRIACGCRFSVQTDDSSGNPLHLGRSTRRIRGRLARAVHHRDHGHCQAPGCANPTTEIHHIWHWADGGPTCLTNLISLCGAHHWLVHDGGWNIGGHSPDTWTFRTPDGRSLSLTPHLQRPSRPFAHDPDVGADAVTGGWAGEPLNLGATIHALNLINRS